MQYLSGIFNFLNQIVGILKTTNVPGFSFSFWTFAVGSFLMASGVSFLKFFLWVKSSSDSEGYK